MTQYPNWLLSAIKALKTLSAEAGRAIAIRTIGISFVAFVTPTSPPHHFDRPKLLIVV
jgi:hypothetical protein